MALVTSSLSHSTQSPGLMPSLRKRRRAEPFGSGILRLPPVWMVLILWLAHFIDSTDEGNLDHQGRSGGGRRRDVMSEVGRRREVTRNYVVTTR